MNKALLLVLGWLCLLPALSFAQFEERCDLLGCQTNVLGINTGVDYANGGVLYNDTDPATVQDGFWNLVQAPNIPPVNLGPAWVIVPNTAWFDTTAANWISGFNVDDLNANNATGTPYTFERCFCLCEDTEVTLDFRVFADDMIDAISVGGINIPFTNPYQPTPSTGSLAKHNFQVGIPIDTTIALPQGRHCLRVDIRNINGEASGMMLYGDITGANLLTSACCTDVGSICGFKYNDLNGNGTQDFGENGLPNWQINLTPAVVAPQLTDQNGTYCFNNLPPGTYTVSETMQAGWTQTEPGGAGTYTITVAPGVVNSNVDFGNTQGGGGGEPCDGEAAFDWQPGQGPCTIDFFDASSVNPGMQIIAWNWTANGVPIGNTQNLSHIFTNTQSAVVCLEIYAIDEEGCCIRREFCQEIWIEGCEELPCELEVSWNANALDCLYEFTGVINSSNHPVTNWFWDFGDGTTATGQNVNHLFAPGTYNVCVTAIADDGNEECCIASFCDKVVVKDCCIKVEKSAAPSLDEPLIEKARIGNLKVFPNPTSGELTLQTSMVLPATLRVYDLTGQVVREQLIMEPTTQLDLQAVGTQKGMLILELFNDQQDHQYQKVMFQ
ncbi:MAG: PKD domain-containing protein [Bacteroidota bacterium]